MKAFASTVLLWVSSTLLLSFCVSHSVSAPAVWLVYFKPHLKYKDLCATDRDPGAFYSNAHCWFSRIALIHQLKLINHFYYAWYTDAANSLCEGRGGLSLSRFNVWNYRKCQHHILKLFDSCCAMGFYGLFNINCFILSHLIRECDTMLWNIVEFNLQCKLIHVFNNLFVYINMVLKLPWPTTMLKMNSNRIHWHLITTEYSSID